MPVENPSLKLDPYQSQVPLVQLPMPVDTSIQPTPPVPGQFGARGTGALEIGDQILKGFLRGHQYKVERKAREATAAISAADQSTAAAYQQYQDSLAAGKDKTEQEASYKNYLDTFNRAKETKSKFVLPEKPEKGKGGKKKEGEGGGGMMAGVKDFFSANPHIVPQMALLSMQPKAPGMSQETRQIEAQTKSMETNVKVGEAQLEGIHDNQRRAKDEEQRQADYRAVHAAGGFEAVMNNPNADPKMKQVATEMKYSYLDAQSPEGQQKAKFMSQVLNGQSKTWTPQERQLAGSLGVVPEPKWVARTGKNGHEEQILVDPLTNQPVAGSTPLDLGPPAWASQFYAQRAAEKNDIKKAVETNPEAYGVQVGGDPKAMRAQIDAKVNDLFFRTQHGIQSYAGASGKTGYEVQRDNKWISDAVGELDKIIGRKAGNTATFDWPGGQRVQLDREQAMSILGQFVKPPTEEFGIHSFRDQPVSNHGGPDAAAALERDRLWAYQLIKNRIMAMPGKTPLTAEQADTILAQAAPALTKPIDPKQYAGKEEPTKPEQPGWWARTKAGIAGITAPSPAQAATTQGGMTLPPAGPKKMYMYSGKAVALTDDEVKKANAAGIQLESLSGLEQ